MAKNFNSNHVVVAKKGQGCNPCRGVETESPRFLSFTFTVSVAIEYIYIF